MILEKVKPIKVTSRAAVSRTCLDSNPANWMALGNVKVGKNFDLLSIFTSCLTFLIDIPR